MTATPLAENSPLLPWPSTEPAPDDGAAKERAYKRPSRHTPAVCAGGARSSSREEPVWGKQELRARDRDWWKRVQRCRLLYMCELTAALLLVLLNGSRQAALSCFRCYCCRTSFSRSLVLSLTLTSYISLTLTSFSISSPPSDSFFSAPYSV